MSMDIDYKKIDNLQMGIKKKRQETLFSHTQNKINKLPPFNRKR